MTPAATPPKPGPARALRAVAILPARLASTRLPRKMLLRETGRCLFEHTALNVARCARVARVVVATDAAEIEAAARAAGLEVRMTRADHPSGTDRVNEAWSALAAEGERADVVLGVQGDEPELDPADLDALVAAFEDPAVELATLWVPLEDPAELARPSVVKLVCDARGDALYFSRAPIPARVHARADAPADPARRHVGVYAFRPAALARFCALSPGALERQENLEQLRWLEAGGRIRAVRAARAPRGVDTPEDYAAFVERAARRGPATGTPNERDPSEQSKDRVRS